MEKGKDFIFTAEVATKPEVTLGQYKGIEVPENKVEVTDEEIEAELKKVQEQNAREITVDRPAENGDTVVIDFEGTVDGEVFEGGTAANHPLVLGSAVSYTHLHQLTRSFDWIGRLPVQSLPVRRDNT